MLISRKRYEEELNKAWEEGWNMAMEQRNTEDQFRCVHERIDHLENMINKPNQIGFEKGERKC